MYKLFLPMRFPSFLEEKKKSTLNNLRSKAQGMMQFAIHAKPTANWGSFGPGAWLGELQDTERQKQLSNHL